MAEIVTIAGSPSHPSRSAAVLDHARRILESESFSTETITVRALPAEALLFAQFDDPILKAAIAAVTAASGVIIATPVYKAAYSGVLKAFLDLLPQGAFSNKIVFPIATGGSHLGRV